MMMDIFSAVLIVVPLIAPVAYYYGIDPYHLGVIFLMNLELGYVTPPVGLNLFIASFKFQQPVPVVVRASLPFLGAMVVALVLVTYVPALTWVPPPKPTGTLQALRNSVEEGVQFVTTSSMTLASGQAVAKADCEAMEAEPRERCLELFSYFGECRAKPQAERAGCEREWTATYQAEFVPVTQVTLPDDKVLARADCAAAPERAKAACEEAFDELPACVKTTLTAGARLGRECELGKVAPYVAAVTGVASIALPGGVLERAACERARGEDAPDRCVEFFDDELVECLALEIAGDAAGAAGCRQEKVEGYVEEMGPTGLVMQDE
jgi:hypothetical protein